MRRIRVHATGGPEVLTVEEADVPAPAEGQALVEIEAAGVNFIDVNQRSGAYPVALPFTPGTEGAGTVADTGPGVTEVRSGDRVAFAQVPGAYARYVLAPAARLVAIPDGVTTEQAAAVILQGMTAHYLVHSVCELQEGDHCVIHAAAGGVGLLFVQLAKRRGLTVIGTVSTTGKAARARAAGADHVVVYSEDDLAGAIDDITGSAGVRAVFDSVGAATFDASLRCLARRGHLVLFGQASGPVDPVDPRTLQQGGSLFLTRPGLVDYVATRAELEWRSGEVLDLVATGELDVHVHGRYSLKEAAEAHRALEARATSGKLLLLP